MNCVLWIETWFGVLKGYIPTYFCSIYHSSFRTVTSTTFLWLWMCRGSFANAFNLVLIYSEFCHSLLIFLSFCGVNQKTWKNALNCLFSLLLLLFSSLHLISRRFFKRITIAHWNRKHWIERPNELSHTAYKTKLEKEWERKGKKCANVTCRTKSFFLKLYFFRLILQFLIIFGHCELWEIRNVNKENYAKRELNLCIYTDTHTHSHSMELRYGEKR